jgi:hypothetical protein
MPAPEAGALARPAGAPFRTLRAHLEHCIHTYGVGGLIVAVLIILLTLWLFEVLQALGT